MIDDMTYAGVLDLLKPQREMLNQMGQAWQQVGASGLAILVDDVCIARYPSEPDTAQTVSAEAPMLDVPLAVDSQTLRLCAFGLADADYQPRLCADARILQTILERETELNHLTEALITYQDQTVALYDLNHALQYVSQPYRIMQIIVEQVTKLLVCDATFFVMPGDTTPIVATTGRLSASEDDLKTWRQAVKDVCGHQIRQDNENGYLLLIPVASGESQGVLGCTRTDQAFTMPEIKLLSAVAEQAGSNLHRAWLHARSLEQTRIRAELNVARHVQQSFLPEPPQTVPGLDVWATSKPALEVGGDFYDFVTREHDFFVSLGDVAGKGVSAALLMAMSRTTLRVLKDSEPAEMLAHFNDTLYDDLSRVDSFVTLFTGQYDSSTHILTYANAGHSPVIFCSAAGHAELLEADSPPMGVLPQSLAQNHVQFFEPGDVLVIASDGIPEATLLDGTLLGYEAVERIIERHRRSSARFIGEMLLKAAAEQPVQDDDRTLIVIKRVK